MSALEAAMTRRDPFAGAPGGSVGEASGVGRIGEGASTTDRSRSTGSTGGKGGRTGVLSGTTRSSGSGSGSGSGSSSSSKSSEEILEWLAWTAAVDEGTNMARALATLPPNVLTPGSFRNLIARIVMDSKVVLFLFSLSFLSVCYAHHSIIA